MPGREKPQYQNHSFSSSHASLENQRDRRKGSGSFGVRVVLSFFWKYPYQEYNITFGSCNSSGGGKRLSSMGTKVERQNSSTNFQKYEKNFFSLMAALLITALLPLASSAQQSVNLGC